MNKKARDLTAFSQCAAIGIDVSKATLEVAGLDGTTVWTTQLANTAEAIESLASALSDGGYHHKLICESTGHYHLLLGMIMARQGLDLRIINPLQSSKHQQARIRKTKTDRHDAYVLATMCETERNLPKTADLQPGQVLIRLKQGQLQALDKQLQQMKRSLQTYTETYERLNLPVGESLSGIEQAIQTLIISRKRLQQELEGLLASSLAARADIAQLRPIPGFSPLVAGLVSTAFDRQANSARAWVAYAGLDVSVRQSGTWRGRGKLTKRGNRFLRKRLCNAAWGAAMNYTEVRRYYDAIKAAGRNHVEALCIIARKLLRIAYAILIKGKEYDPTVAFAAQ